MSIAVVTDSTADIPTQIVEKLDIHVIPNILVIGDKSMQDGIDISREEFYQILPELESPPTTATAASGAYEILYRNLLEAGADQVVSIHASMRLSGILNAASAAASGFSGRVHVIDSRQISLGLGFQVIAAAEAARDSASLAAIVERVEDIRKRVRLIAMLDTLEYVRRSGRVSWARARLGNLLRIKPFVEVQEGQVLSRGEVRTRSRGIERLRKMLSELAPLERLAILHSNAEEDARQMLASFDPQLMGDSFLVNVTPIIGSHVGPNGLGFTAVTAAHKSSLHKF